MVKELIESGYFDKMDLNCAETLIYAANIEYNLNLDQPSLKMAGAFGGGMAVESVCGAISGALMAIGMMVIEKNAHESTKVKEITSLFIKRFEKLFGSKDCVELKKTHRDELSGCKDLLIRSGKLLDDLVYELELTKQ